MRDYPANSAGSRLGQGMKRAFYIPTRHPNSHPQGAPFEHYGPLQSGEAICYAGEIARFVRAQMA